MLNTGGEAPTGAAEVRKNYGAPTLQSRLIPLGALILLGVWLFFLYRHSFSDAPASFTMTGIAQENADFIKSAYQRTGGKFDKLTDEEKNKLRRMAGVHAEDAFRAGGTIK